jgi:hypothetical protein
MFDNSALYLYKSRGGGRVFFHSLCSLSPLSSYIVYNNFYYGCTCFSWNSFGYEMLVGAGILAGGAVTANKMQKEIQKTIDTNPGVIDEALKNIFMGPARELITLKC